LTNPVHSSAHAVLTANKIAQALCFGSHGCVIRQLFECVGKSVDRQPLGGYRLRPDSELVQTVTPEWLVPTKRYGHGGLAGADSG
jgi:hypothetical protein